MHEFQEKQSMWKKFKNFFVECKRVFIITKKPNKEEFKTIVKISGIGIIAIGLLGFIIQIAWQLI